MAKNKKNIAMIIAIILLFNPNFNTLDILPDFIAYLILYFSLHGSERLVPYFKELKIGLRNLAIITGVKIPAMLIMYANMYTGRDIVPLFTTVFAAAELIVLIPLINNARGGLFYLGERSSATALIKPFPISKRENARRIDPDSLYKLTLIFACVKSVIPVIPELCLLTRESPEANALANKLYPILTLLSLLSVLVLGVIWLSLALKYHRAVTNEGGIRDAVISLANEDTLRELELENIEEKKRLTLNLFALASLFTLDLTFGDFENVNLLPRFIYAIFIFAALNKYLTSKRGKTLIRLLLGAYSLVSVILTVATMSFYEKFEYMDLYHASAAKEAYIGIEVLSCVETAVLVAFAFMALRAFILFVRESTLIPPSDPRYSKTDRDTHRTYMIKGAGIIFSAVIISLLKTVNVFLTAVVSLDFAETGTMVARPTAPWLSTLIFILSVILTVYSFYFVSTLKEEGERIE